MLGSTRYRVIEATDDITRCVKLRRVYGSSNEYEEVDDEPPIDVRVGTPDLPLSSKSHNSKHNMGGNSSINYSNDPADNDRNNSSNNIHPLNIEDDKTDKNGNNYYSLGSPNNKENNNKCGCGKPCILNIWMWAIIWLLALAAIAAPIVGMLKRK